TSTNNPSSSAASTARAFAGIFGQLQLPVDLSLDGVDFEGEVILPDAQGRAKLILTGGGLGAGREGKFDLKADATLTDPEVSATSLRGALAARMDTPRTFTRISAKFDAAAMGAKFPSGVKLVAELTAAHGPNGEN